MSVRVRWFEKQTLFHEDKLKINLPSKHFNLVSMLPFGWYDVATWDNVKSTLKQRCVFQSWNLQHRTTSHQRCVFQRWYEQRWQCRNNVVIFSVEFHNVGKRQNNVVNMTIFKKNKNKNISNRIHEIQSFNYYFIIFFSLLPMLRRIYRRVLAKSRKFLKDHEKYCIART